MTANGHTTGAEPETFLEFVNFDGRLTGETARAVIRHAEANGVTPQEALGSLLANAIWLSGLVASEIADRGVTVEPMTINAGNGGFHVLTFVADGYGNLVAEDSAGEELARMPWRTEDDGHDTHDEFRTLAGMAFAKQAAPTTD